MQQKVTVGAVKKREASMKSVIDKEGAWGCMNGEGFSEEVWGQVTRRV